MYEDFFEMKKTPFVRSIRRLFISDYLPGPPSKRCNIRSSTIGRRLGASVDSDRGSSKEGVGCRKKECMTCILGEARVGVTSIASCHR